MTGPTVLVVDDEPRYVRWISLNLRGAGYRVLEAGDGPGAVESTAEHQPDLLLLDIGLPGFDGLEVCRRVRDFSSLPIIILTAKAAEADKVAGLDAGADDYLAKPFGPPELLARVRAALRRARLAEALTPTEYRLLVHLAQRAGRVVLPEELLAAVWGPEYRDENQHVRLYVSRLRRKLEPDPDHPRYILTRPGIGYLFAPTD
jgi:DNA-binding response OmpR family regulator